MNGPLFHFLFFGLKKNSNGISLRLEDKISSLKNDESSCFERVGLNSSLFEFIRATSSRSRQQRVIYRNRDKKFTTSRCDKVAVRGLLFIQVFAQNRMLQSLPPSWQNASTKITLYYPATMPPEPLKASLPLTVITIRPRRFEIYLAPRKIAKQDQDFRQSIGSRHFDRSTLILHCDIRPVPA